MFKNKEIVNVIKTSCKNLLNMFSNNSILKFIDNYSITLFATGFILTALYAIHFIAIYLLFSLFVFLCLKSIGEL